MNNGIHIVTKPYNCYRKPKRNCIVCGKEFTYNKKTQTRCSPECFHKDMKTIMKGENNPSYIDGRAKNKRCYRGDNWEEIRLEVYKRDNFTCQTCGKHCNKKEIQCHHIEPWKINYNNNLDNLTTLCVKCHTKLEEERRRIIWIATRGSFVATV